MAVMIDSVLPSEKWAAIGLELVQIDVYEVGPNSTESTVREHVATLFAIRSVGGGLHPGRYTSKDAATAVLDAFLEAHLLADQNRLIPVMDATGATASQTRAAFIAASTLMSRLWAGQAQPHYEILEGQALAEFLALPVGTRGPRSRHRLGR